MMVSYFGFVLWVFLHVILVVGLVCQHCCQLIGWKDPAK